MKSPSVQGLNLIKKIKHCIEKQLQEAVENVVKQAEAEIEKLDVIDVEELNSRNLSKTMFQETIKNSLEVWFSLL